MPDPFLHTCVASYTFCTALLVVGSDASDGSDGFNRLIQVLVAFRMQVQSCGWLGFWMAFVTFVHAKLAESREHTNHTSTSKAVGTDIFNLCNYVYMINVDVNGFQMLEMTQKVKRGFTLYCLWVQLCWSYTQWHKFLEILWTWTWVFLWMTHL